MKNNDPHITVFDTMIAFEASLVNEPESVVRFQKLIDNGTIWKLERLYVRAAHHLIQAGRCMLAPTGHYDYYGNYVPSRFEVKPGSPGTSEFIDASK